MPSRVSSSVSSRRSDSEAALVCGGRSSGWDCCRLSRIPSRRGGCCLMSSCAGKSSALSAPAKAPSFGSSISRPITSQTPTFTPSRRTGPSSSRWDSMKKRGSSGGGFRAGVADSIICFGAAEVPSGGSSSPRLVIRLISSFNLGSPCLAFRGWGRCHSAGARPRPWPTGPGRGRLRPSRRRSSPFLRLARRCPRP